MKLKTSVMKIKTLVFNRGYLDIVFIPAGGRYPCSVCGDYSWLIFSITNKQESDFIKCLETVFTNALNPTPEELTLFELEFGEESTEAYLKFLKSGAK